MGCGYPPMACRPREGHNSNRVGTSLRLTCARSARATDGPPLMRVHQAMIHPHWEDDEVKERTGAGRVMTAMFRTGVPHGVVP
jgi:hypothetical protein